MPKQDPEEQIKELKTNLKRVSLDDVYDGGIKGSSALNTGIKRVLEDDLPKAGEKGAKKLGKKATEVSADIIQAMAKGISNIPDYNVRATVFAGMFGARLTDVIGMRTTRRLAEMGSQPRPYFDVETGIQENPDRTGRKQAGPSKKLPPVFEALARKLHSEAGPDGVIFKATTPQVTNALKKYVFPEIPQKILDQLDRNPKDFTDLRRIIAAYVIKNVNPSAASGIISHKLTSAEEFDKVMDTFYVGIDDPKGDVERTKGLILFEKELAKGLNVTDGKQLARELKLDLPDSFNATYPATKVKVSPTGQATTSVVEATEEEIESSKKVKIAQDYESEQAAFLRGEEKKEKGLTLAEKNIERQKKIQDERKLLDETKKTEVKKDSFQTYIDENPDDIEKIKQRKKSKFGMTSTNKKLLGLSGPLAYMGYRGYKSELIDQGYSEKEAQLTASLFTAADFVPYISGAKMILESSTVAASERDPFSPFTTMEEEGQRVIDVSKERDFRQNISPQLDDEQEVGKEMMLKYKRETALQDMRAKTKSKLDEQLQQLNLGRQ